ncbi:MAG: protoheme IX farnesyltransferase [Chlamydiales bacterium]|nr:protoheme IX farnesyltransferase [Chlamydiales bacterium]
MERVSRAIPRFDVRSYYMLTKPGIIFGNVVTTTAGFMLASRGYIDLLLFLATLIGLSCIIASSCIFNNYIDRDSDRKMSRTKNRGFARGIISVQYAILLSIVLGLSGTLFLFLFVNFLTAMIALLGFFVYVIVYSFVKYHTIHGTLIGSIAGALPPVIGYCAVSNRFDLGALILFAIVAIWQMPHFFAIAMFRLKDYTAASIPVLPVKKGVHVTKIQMLLYIIAFIITSLLLPLFNYTGYLYLVVTVFFGVAWLLLSIKGFFSTNDKLWARKMFVFSLIVIMALSISIAFSVS